MTRMNYLIPLAALAACGDGERSPTTAAADRASRTAAACETVVIDPSAEWRGAAAEAVSGRADGEPVTAMVHFRGGRVDDALIASVGGQAVAQGTLLAPAAGEPRLAGPAGEITPGRGGVVERAADGHVPPMPGIAAVRLTAGGVRRLVAGAGAEIEFLHVVPEPGRGPCAPPAWR